MARSDGGQLVLLGAGGYIVYQAGIRGQLGAAVQRWLLGLSARASGNSPPNNPAPNAPAPAAPAPGAIHTLTVTDVDGNTLQYQDGSICRADGHGCYQVGRDVFVAYGTEEGDIQYWWAEPNTMIRVDTGQRYSPIASYFFRN